MTIADRVAFGLSAREAAFDQLMEWIAAHDGGRKISLDYDKKINKYVVKVGKHVGHGTTLYSAVAGLERKLPTMLSAGS